MKNTLNNNKFEVIIICKNCGSKDVIIDGYSSHTYDDGDDDIKLNIKCCNCKIEIVIKI